jgi:quinolinate synthase
MLLWPGICIVHDTFSEKKLIQLKVRYPEALVVAHPECTESVLRLADHIGSTTSILNFVTKSQHRQFIIVTEPGIIHQMEKRCPDKVFIPAPPDSSCACNECPYMRLNTLEKLYLCMRDRRPEITLDPEICRRALIPLERMLEISARAAA